MHAGAFFVFFSTEVRVPWHKLRHLAQTWPFPEFPSEGIDRKIFQWIPYIPNCDGIDNNAKNITDPEPSMHNCQEAGIPAQYFRSSSGWTTYFMLWNGLFLGQQMTLCERLPSAYENKGLIFSPVWNFYPPTKMFSPITGGKCWSDPTELQHATKQDSRGEGCMQCHQNVGCWKTKAHCDVGRHSRKTKAATFRYFQTEDPSKGNFSLWHPHLCAQRGVDDSRPHGRLDLNCQATTGNTSSLASCGGQLLWLPRGKCSCKAGRSMHRHCCHIGWPQPVIQPLDVSIQG